MSIDRLPSTHYYKIYDASTNGDSTYSRWPALPAELALYIMHLANCTYTLSTSSTTNEQFTASSDGPLVRKLWITSPPLKRRMLWKLASVRLVTNSTHQGWVSLPDQGSWSWWDLGVVRGSVGTGTPLCSFVSHRHGVHDYRNQEHLVLLGRNFMMDHELWTSYDQQYNETSESTLVASSMDTDGGAVWDGDRIAVYGCAQYPGWMCRGAWAKLEFEVYWEPRRAERWNCTSPLLYTFMILT